MELHHTLPFSSIEFCYYALIVIFLMLIGKYMLSRYLPYKVLLAISSISFFALLFPKPWHFLGLISYLYLATLGLRKYYKSSNIIFPMLLLALPMFFMKSFNIIENEEKVRFIINMKNIFQVAGMSYVVFKVISLYIDERNNKSKISPIDFFNYTSFVPTWLIGPLDRYKRFQSDVENGYQNINYAFYSKGWNNLLIGLLFKFMIAEAIRRLLLAHLVDDGSFIYHASYAYTYLFYLFFDFAGYSLLAIAFGYFIGIQVPTNFDKPFLAVNPKEFWKKWHKSLGDWLGDYFFKPIFKDLTSRKIFTSIQRQNIALFLTFSLMGFWNGFELHYIASGMLFGLYSTVHNYYIYRCKKNKRDVVFSSLPTFAVKIISIILMLNSVAFAIYIFSGNLF